MTWKKYKEWLLENVLQKEAGQDKYTLSPAAREKYSLTEINGEELEQALNDFLGSVDRIYGDLTYYPLIEWEEGKTWAELFPERREMIFGRRKNPVLPSREVWNALAKLYDYWGTEAQRAQGLREEAERLWAEIEQASKKVVIGLISENKNNNFLERLTNWLGKYELLGQEAQKSLNGHKKLIQRDENSLREGAEKLNEKPIREEEIKEENEEIAKLKERISLLTRQIEYIWKSEIPELKEKWKARTIIFISVVISFLLTIIISFLLSRRRIDPRHY